MTMKAMLLAAAVTTTVALPAFAGPPPHSAFTPAQIQWGPAPDMLPPGAKAAVLYGDPSKPALFIVRLRLPAGYKIPAHWHPTDETVTVLKGEFQFGHGNQLQAGALRAFPAGSFVMAPAKSPHFAMSKQGAEVQVAGMGPFEFYYVNPDDDPRNGASD